MKKLISISLIVILALGLMGCSDGFLGSEEHNLTVETEGIGKVKKEPNQDSYEGETEVTLTAEPEVDFKRWKGDLNSEEATEKIVVDDDYQVVGEFYSKYVFVERGTSKSSLFTFNESGNNVEKLAEFSEIDYLNYPVYQPQQKKVVLIGEKEDSDGNHLEGLYSVDIYSGEKEELIAPASKSLLSGVYHPAFWKEDNEKLITTDGEEDKPATFEIYEIDTVNGSKNQLTDNDKPETAPNYSPDGSEIVFASSSDGEDYSKDPSQGGDMDLYIMNADGSNRRRLAGNEDQHDGMEGILWIPNTDKILFSSVTSSDEWEIYIVDADGENMEQAKNYFNISNKLGGLNFSRNGSKILLREMDSNNNTIAYYVADIDGSDKVELNFDSSEIYATSFAPGNSRFLFEGSNGEIYVAETATGEVDMVVEGAADGSVWNRSGDKVIFRDTNDENFYSVPADGGEPTQLTTESQNWDNIGNLKLLDWDLEN